jgi:hypothetical protein
VSKGALTRWYIGAWVAAVVAVVVAYMAGRSAIPSTAGLLSTIAWGVALIAGLMMLVAWVGVLIRLGRLNRWGWFVAVLVLQLIGLGIIGIVAYAVAGPSDEMVVTRPTVSAG